MTREEWIRYHDKQAKRHGENETFFEKPCREMFDEEHGLFQYNITTDNDMVMAECIGHLSFWNKVIPWLAKQLGCKKIIAFSKTDNPERLERLYQSKAVSCINGEWRFERMVE